MTDNKLGLNISDEDAREFARLLLGAADRLVKLDQFNDFVRLSAIDDPFRFITDAEKHADALTLLQDAGGNLHVRINGLTPEGQREKISAIKALRGLMGWGLADSKWAYEKFPNTSQSFANNVSTGYSIISAPYSDRTSLESSSAWNLFSSGKNLFYYEYVRLPVGIAESSPPVR